ncbi:MAG: hypothetical protein AB8C13_06105 [Phycisphaerales bacterium]
MGVNVELDDTEGPHGRPGPRLSGRGPTAPSMLMPAFVLHN